MKSTNATLVITHIIEMNLVLLISAVLLSLSAAVIKPNRGSVQIDNYLKLLTPTSFLASFYLHLVATYFYLYNFKWCSAFFSECIVEINTPLVFFQRGSISLDFFSLTLITLAYIVGYISLVCINDKVFWTNTKYPTIFNFFLIIVILFVTSDHIFMFFLYYEFLLIPSFLIVYYSSSNQKGVQASIYFLIWTQAGSAIVLAVIATIMKAGEVSYFSDINTIEAGSKLVESAKFFIFLGFGFKIPIWPLYYWLTKTHVEATGAFSMYLSGFLVKTALYGMYKFFISMNWSGVNILFFTVAVVGIVMSSLQMWAQVDLKKIVALCTVQEMNLLIICFIFGQTPIVYFGILFCFMHAILSTLMFFLVDVIQKRFGTRLTTELSGIVHICPNIGLSVVLMCLCFLALPITLKFTCEFAIFAGIMDLSVIIFILVITVTNWLAPIAFCKSWYGVIFSTPKRKYGKVMDLDIKEILITTTCLLLLTTTSMFSIGII